MSNKLKRTRSDALTLMENAKRPTITKNWVDKAQSSEILKLKKQIKGLSKANRHSYDVAQTSLTPGTTAAVGHLMSISQGSSDDQRIGLDLTLRALRYSYSIVANGNSASGGDIFRVIIFRWKGALTGSAPAAAAVLQLATDVDSAYNDAYKDQFTVLYDRKHGLAGAGNGVPNTAVVRKNLKNVTATYTGSSGASFNSNQVFFLLLGSNNTYPSAFNYYNRIFFEA